MTPGQNRVLVLLIILGALELVANPVLKGFFKGVWYQGNLALNGQGKKQ